MPTDPIEAAAKRPPIPVPKGGFKTNADEAQWLAETFAMRISEGFSKIGMPHVKPNPKDLLELLLACMNSASRRGMRDAERASWSNDMSAAPRESDILVAKMPIGWWTRASIDEDGKMTIHGGEFIPTHWRLPPALPTVEG